MITLLLASTSPRRHEILRSAGIAFAPVPPGAEPAGEGPPAQRALLRAAAKAHGASVPLGAATPVLGVDTVVELDGEELGKPDDPDTAVAMLARLQGRSHEVHTGHCLWLPGRDRDLRLLASATVRCRPLTPAAIEAFVAGGSWRGKAGGYGIQDEAGAFMALESGALDTVVGLHVDAVRQLLEAARSEVEG